jgi:hypothetical protein
MVQRHFRIFEALRGKFLQHTGTTGNSVMPGGPRFSRREDRHFQKRSLDFHASAMDTSFHKTPRRTKEFHDHHCRDSRS